MVAGAQSTVVRVVDGDHRARGSSSSPRRRREITVLGMSVHSYGRDLGAGITARKFADLLRA